MTDDTTDDAITARLHRCAINTREAATAITTFARTGADRNERQHADVVVAELEHVLRAWPADDFVVAAMRHADTVEACTHYAKAFMVAARSSSVDENIARLRQRIDACVTIAEALDEASAALLHWSMKRWSAPVSDHEEA